jgi:pimeloyl-ACP methyl ester carboxylesterase
MLIRIILINLISAISPVLHAGQQLTDISPSTGECVVLLHGLGRTSKSMEKLNQAFLRHGFTTANIQYPSREFPIAELAKKAVEEGVSSCLDNNATRIHFVSHSLGGILIRYYLSRYKIERLGKVVQIAPPNQGSMVAETFRNQQWFKWLTGPSGQQLGTGSESIPLMLGPVDFPLGVIAGNEHHPVDNWMAEMMPGDSDGKVQVDHARVDGMADFIVLPFNHITIMAQDAVIHQVLYFLEHGKFDHGPKMHNNSGD